MQILAFGLNLIQLVKFNIFYSSSIDSSHASSVNSNQIRKHIIDLSVSPASFVRFQGNASLARENTRSDAADVAGIAKIARAILPNSGNLYQY